MIYVVYIILMLLFSMWMFVPAILGLPMPYSELKEQYPVGKKRAIIILLAGPLAWFVFSITSVARFVPIDWIPELMDRFSDFHRWLKK